LGDDEPFGDAVSGVGARVALAIVSLSAGAVGWYGAGQLRGNEESGTALAATAIYGCPTPSGSAIGAVNAGDEVQLVGVTDDRWAVIRHPANSEQLAWLPLAMIETDSDAGDLPQVTCGAAAQATASTVASTTTSTPLVSETTTSSTTTSSTTTTLTTTTIASTTTAPSDVTPPTVTLTANRAYFYVSPVGASCAGQDRLEITVVLTDPTLPVTIQSIQATWTTPGGVVTATPTPIGGNRFLLQVTTNGPTSGELPVTISASGSDGAGNVGSGQLIVALRNPPSFGCS